jgi:hypothetical protein
MDGVVGCRLAEERPRARGNEMGAEVDALAMVCRSVCAGVSRRDEMGDPTLALQARQSDAVRLRRCGAGVLRCWVTALVLSCLAGSCRQAWRHEHCASAFAGCGLRSGFAVT